MRYPHPIIAREGWPFVGFSFFIAIAASIGFGFWFALPFWLIAIFVLQFFRDPPRQLPSDPNAIVSPADGRIVFVGKAHDPFLHREALKISVFMNVFNVHSNRSPVDGVIQNVWYHPGKFFNADLDKASAENERNALCIKTSAGDDITCVQIAGLVARRILCYVGKGDQLARGQRYGFIRFGSRVDLYLPLDAFVKVSIGDTVFATATVLAES
jgi:phosphatidylserine decarboxylase